MPRKATQPSLPAERHSKHQPPTPEQIRAEQRQRAENDTTAAKAKAAAAAEAITTALVPASPPTSTAVAALDNRAQQARYLDEIAPASIVGRGIKFNGKDGKHLTIDDDEAIADSVDFIALPDQVLVGHVRFHGTGEPVDRAMGLLSDGFIPRRETLGDTDQTTWELGLDGKPADPWQHHVYLPLQRADTGEMFTFLASSPTSRRAVGNLLRHANRLPSDMYPLIRLKVGGFQHRDTRVGWVNTPVLTVVGRHRKDDTTKPPDSSLAADMSDSIPF